MAGNKSATARTVAMACKAGARLKVTGAYYGVATAEASAETSSTSEMGSATEVRASTPEVASTSAPTAEVASTATPDMTTAATATVTSSGAGRHGGTRRERGHGQDPEGLAKKSCRSHLGRHGDLHSVASRRWG
jgi:outer membrane biosynthesis protein TonB